MNKTQKILLITTILAIMAFSNAAITLVHASSLPFQNNQLVNPYTLTIAGSSTVYPIAVEEANQSNFPTYWNGLVAANPEWGASTITESISIAGLGSGTAIPALTAGTADIGEMSRPPQTSAAEWLAPTMTSMQIWAVGIDSVAIVLSPDMTWFPKNLTTLQVADLFANTTSSSYETPYYNTWGDFLTAYYNGTIPSSINGVSINSTILDETINRAVRDPTSGTFDCFDNYFAKPSHFEFEHKVSGVVTGSQEMAPYSYCKENINIYDTVSAGNLGSDSDYIGFISLGYLETYGHMIGLNIAYNLENAPYSLINYVQPYSWGPYVTPTRANVEYGYSGIQGPGATGQYMAWRYLWEVTPSSIPSKGPLLETGVWIAYMRLLGTTLNGASNFVNDSSYITMNPDDMAGGTVLNSSLEAYNPLPGQTQTIPNGKVGYIDITYFVSAYIAYYTKGIYNPYADLNADGKIDFNDIKLFVADYLAYYAIYG